MTKKPSRLTQAIRATAEHMHARGVLDDETYEQITLRDLPPEARQPPAPLNAEEIRALRQQARMSQSVFARHLNMSTGQLSKLERGAENATGTTLALLSAIKRNGIQVVL